MHDNGNFAVQEQKDYCDACKKLVRDYDSKLRRQFSRLIFESVEALKQKLSSSDDQMKFNQDLARQYRKSISTEEAETMNIQQIIDQLCEKQGWEFEEYEGLFSILEEYVDEETIKLRDSYEDLVTGWYEVKVLSEELSKRDIVIDLKCIIMFQRQLFLK